MPRNEIYFDNPIRPQRLNRISQIMLKSRGRHDWKKKNIQQNEEDNYISPFINQEVHLFLASVQIEMERLNWSCLRLRKAILNSGSGIQKAELRSDKLTDEKAYWAKSQKDYLDDFSISSHTEQEIYWIQIKRETEAAKLRCQRLYELLIAKLSAYWSGVLQAGGGAGGMNPLFQTETLMAEVREQIALLTAEEETYADSKER